MIPNKLYKQIHQNMPIVCVDMVVVDKNNRFMLVKRANEPVKGRWWFAGGRVKKGEKLLAAVKRQALKELGVNVKVIKQVGFDETMYNTGPYGTPTHTVNAIYKVQVNPDKIVLDDQAEQCEWFDKINPSWNAYIKKYISLALLK